MRDGLTALAGLFIIMLVAALAGPAFVDWTQWRGEIDRRLGDTIGVPLTTTGDIAVQLLPHPQLALSGIVIAQPVSAGSSASDALLRIQQLKLSLSLPALIKGEIRVSSARADGAVLTVLHDQAGRLRLPAAVMSEAARRASIEALTLSRSEIRLRSMATGGEQIIGPIAAEITAQAMAGPWKIEAEISGQPIRLVTGAHGSLTGLPFKLASDNGVQRLEGEGQLRFMPEDGFTATTLTGQMNLALKGKQPDEPGLAAATGSAAPTVLSARGGISGGKVSFSAISLDIGEVGKLEGDGEWEIAGGAPLRLKLRSRRMVGDALADTGAAGPELDGIIARLPPLDLALALDQLTWRGEEMVDVAANLAVRANRVHVTHGVAKAAGAALSVAGEAAADGSSGRIHLGIDAPNLQRAALALGRLGLAPESADALSGLAPLTLSTSVIWQGNAVRLEDLMASSRKGILAGRIEHRAGYGGIFLNGRGIDLAGWTSLKPLASPWLATLDANARLDIDLNLSDTAWREGPKGSARIVAARDAGRWRVSRLEASGFGGLTIKAADRGPSNALVVQVDAPDAAPVAGIAAVLLPEIFQRGLTTRVAQFSPLVLSVTLPVSEAGNWQARGFAGPRLAVALEGMFGASDKGQPDGPGIGLSKARVEGEGHAILDLVDPRLSAAGLAAAAGLGNATGPGNATGVGSAKGLGDLGRMTLEYAAIAQGAAGVSNSAALTLNGPVLSAGWEMAPDGQGRASIGPFRAQWRGATPASLTGILHWQEDGLSLEDARLTGSDGASPPLADGRLELGRDGTVGGRVAMQKLDVRLVRDLAWGTPNQTSQRFSQAPELPDARIALSAGQVVAGSTLIASNWSGKLIVDNTSLRLEDMGGTMAGGMLGGSLRLGREGSLRGLGWRLSLAGANAGIVTGKRLLGRLDIKLDGGTSGETSQRLLAGLGGAGQFSVSDGRIADLAPSALPAALEGQELHDGLGQAFVAALGEGEWPLGSAGAPLTLSGGVLRLGRIESIAGGTRLGLSGLLDFRSQRLDISAELTPAARSANRNETTAKAAVAWRGALDAPAREIDIDGVRTVLAARELARELERVAAFEADARERAMFARRLRSEREAKEREMREREAAAKAAKAREEIEAKARADALRPQNRDLVPEAGQTSPAARLGPMQILPIPLPSPSVPAGRAPAL